MKTYNLIALSVAEAGGNRIVRRTLWRKMRGRGKAEA